MLTLQIPTAFSDSSLPAVTADPVLSGANGGVKWLFDLSSAISWPSQTTPANNNAVVDISNTGNGLFIQSGAGSMGFAGGGFDFSSITSKVASINSSAGILSSIFGAPNQYFLVVMYAKLPSQANWNSAGSLMSMMGASQNALGYTAAPEMVMLAQGTGGVLSARRQNGAGTADQIAVTVPAAAYGQVAQIAYWRNASGQFLQLYTAASGTTSATTTVNSNNAQDFSALAYQMGLLAPFTNLSLSGQTNAMKMKIYRGWVEDLSISGRSPGGILSADWSRVSGRFS